MNKKKFWIIALGFGVPFGLIMIAFRATMDGEFSVRSILSGLIAALVTGVFFAWGMQGMALRLRNAVKVDIGDDEPVLRKGPANHFRGLEGVGGMLFLTPERLIFASHPYNLQNHQVSFITTDITQVRATKTLGILRNGLVISLRNGEQHRFVVENHQTWADAIQSVMEGGTQGIPG